MKYNISFNILLSLTLLASNSLMAASFNCGKAATEIEHLICDDPILNDADSKLGKAYKKLRRVLSKAETKLLVEEQRSWLEKRDLELINCSELDCEVRFYEIRIKQLGPVAKAGFNCKKAKTSPEKKICASRLLKHADGRLNSLYKLVKQPSPEFIQQQRDWIAVRNSRLNSSDCDKKCVWQFYQERTEALINQVYFKTAIHNLEEDL
ncbi:lysozyme inhibitor LprI family protein [Candidatus Halobeggiatoa sp. HSG11]|nr:lysozyme inhibitor LprI family protein [Candidatus Halobeggiatoa sp. HSG11]